MSRSSALFLLTTVVVTAGYQGYTRIDRTIGTLMLKLILYVFAFLFLGSLALWLFWQTVSAVYYLFWAVFWLALLGFIAYLTWCLVNQKMPALPMAKKVEYKVFDVSKPYVYAFRMEPELKDIVMLTDELHAAKLELAGDVIQLNNQTTIKILEDNGKEAVKVQLKGTKEKEKVFWVPRSSIVRDDNKGDKPRLLGS